MSKALASVLLPVFACMATAQQTAAQQPGGLLGILGEELNRNFEVLKQKADPAPYFLGYSVVESENSVMGASMGALTRQNQSRSRHLDVTVRVGSYGLDNYHHTRGQGPRFAGAIPIPLDDNAAAIRRIAWLETDRVYRLAAERLIQIKTNQQVRVAQEDDSADFSHEDPAQYREPPAKLRFTAAEWATNCESSRPGSRNTPAY